MLERKICFFNLIKLAILISFIFLLPTRNIFDYLIKWLTNSSNQYFIILIKFVLVVFLEVFWILYDYKDGLYVKKIKSKIYSNPMLFYGILIIFVEILISLILLKLDKTNIFPISSEGWLTYITTLFSSTLTVVGLLFTINEYVRKGEEKTKPNIKFKILDPSEQNDYEYCCNFILSDKDIETQEIYIELNNLKSDSYILYPEWSYNNKRISFIGNFYSKEDFLTIIENHSKIKIKLILPIIEGMSSIRTYFLTLICSDENNNKYSIDVHISYNRYDLLKSKIITNEAKKIGRYGGKNEKNY